MPAIGQIHAHDRITGLKQSEIHSQISLCARMRLYIGVFGAEQFLRPLNGQIFRNIHILTAAVITMSRVAFRIFIGHYTAHGFHDRYAGMVFRGNHFQIILLTGLFQFNRIINLFIRLL